MNINKKIICITGESNTGKTHFSNLLAEYINYKTNNKVVVIDFSKPLELAKAVISFFEDSSVDFLIVDHVYSLDMLELLIHKGCTLVKVERLFNTLEISINEGKPELSLDAYDFDVIINNYGTTKELSKQALALVEKIYGKI